MTIIKSCAFRYVKFESLDSRLCSSTAATSRKQVTNRIYIAVFSRIRLISVVKASTWKLIYLISMKN